MDNYGTVDGFKTYHNARGNPIGTYEDDDIAAALLIGSEWLDGSHRGMFPGYKVGQRAQVREWPRYDAFDRNTYVIDSATVPVEMENATYEAAFIQLAKPGSLSSDYTPAKYQSVAVDGAVSVKFATFNSAVDMQTTFINIERILGPILTGCGNVSSLSGSTQH